MELFYDICPHLFQLFRRKSFCCEAPQMFRGLRTSPPTPHRCGGEEKMAWIAIVRVRGSFSHVKNCNQRWAGEWAGLILAFFPFAVVLLAVGVAEGASCQGHGSCWHTEYRQRRELSTWCAYISDTPTYSWPLTLHRRATAGRLNPKTWALI